MKKLLSIVCLVLVCFSFSSCNRNAGKTNNVVINIGESTKFSRQEIQAAVDSVINKFKDFEGCDLKKLWYDEEKSNAVNQGYISGGKGSQNGVQKENVIVLFSSYDVDATGGDGSLNPNSTYDHWNWILIRDSKTGSWKVDDWGY